VLGGNSTTTVIGKCNLAASKTPTWRTAGHISAMWVLGSLRRAAVSPGCAQGHSFQLCGVVRVHSLICAAAKGGHKRSKRCC
jgi:hypothetical protein